MTNVNITPFRIKPLDEHTLGHVLSEMADQTRDDGPLDRDGWREILEGVGYHPENVTQILERWFVKCSTCGEDATHLWACVGEDGTISSLLGNGKFSPSCDNCTGEPSTFETPQTGVLRCPLDFDPSRGLRFDDHPAKVAEWLCDRSEDTLGQILKQIDIGSARGMLALAMKMFAQHVAMTSRNEIFEHTFDEVLLDLLTDARGS